MYLNRVWSHHIAKALGFKSHHYPDVQMAGEIDGVSIFLITKEDAIKRSKKKNPTRPHRVWAKCPACGKLIPAGRLAQHARQLRSTHPYTIKES